jgi:hypothetical protein
MARVSLPALLLVVALLGFTLIRGAEAQEHTEPPVVVRWPSADYPTLQRAIDAAPDGGKVKIQAGSFALTEPLYVEGKALILEGAGSGRGAADPSEVTRLVGPPPSEVVDREGNVILRAESVIGLLNVTGADVTVKSLQFSGFDAAVVTRDGPRGAGSPLKLKDFVIENTGRGIVALSSANVHLKGGSISSTKWNGVVVSPPAGGHQFELLANDTEVGDAGSWGYFFVNALATLKNNVVAANAAGGVYGEHCAMSVKDSLITDNNRFGIRTFDCLLSVNGGVVNLTHEVDGSWGVAFRVDESTVKIKNVLIKDNDLAGVLGVDASDISLKNVAFSCCSFYLLQSAPSGVAPDWHDQGGVTCECGVPQSCTLVGQPLPAEAPTPVA